MAMTPEQRKAAGERLRRGRLAKKAERDAAAAAKVATPVPAPAPQPSAKPVPKPARKLTWDTLPTYAPRCAKSGSIPDDAPVFQIPCVECKQMMWTRDAKKEDLCETCEYTLKERVRDMGARNRKAATDRLVVPSGGESFINPFKTGGGLF